MTHDVTWGDTPLCGEYGLFVEYGSISCPPPSPKLSIVSIPGGVDLDLTDALTGHAAYELRTVSFALRYDGRGGRTWQEVANDVTNLLHGAESDFELSWDPGFTYHGRASVTGVTYIAPRSCRISVEITAEPWKLRELHTETLSAAGGVTVECQSGRRPVHPLISCTWPVTVGWQGAEYVVPAGQTYRLADVTFRQGANRLWLCTYRWRTATWADVASVTWDDLAGIEWAKVVVGDDPDPSEGAPGNVSVTLQWEESYL
ncbi:MAG TPA: hypothetical protein IAA15_02700 [Candidatus Olsenella pullicola]|nr:hypothetical protein [Candidatus Olsenella pullicola]